MVRFVEEAKYIYFFIFKFGGGEVWKTQLERPCEKYKNITYSQGEKKRPKIQQNKGILTGLVTFCVGSAF